MAGGVVLPGQGHTSRHRDELKPLHCVPSGVFVQTALSSGMCVSGVLSGETTATCRAGENSAGRGQARGGNGARLRGAATRQEWPRGYDGRCCPLSRSPRPGDHERPSHAAITRDDRRGAAAGCRTSSLSPSVTGRTAPPTGAPQAHTLAAARPGYVWGTLQTGLQQICPSGHIPGLHEVPA